jgi:hypothetical protein
LKEVELVRRKLESDLEHTHAADRKKADLIGELTEQLESLRSEHEKVINHFVYFQYCALSHLLLGLSN